jgi:hypothetical protein
MPTTKRPRSFKRNSRKSMTWGTLPEFREFKAYVEAARNEDDEPVVGPPGDVWHMEVVGRDKESVKKALKVLFASDAKVAYEQFDGKHGKYGIRFLDLVSLHKFILALLTISEMEAEEHPDGTPMEGPGDLASSIMDNLGFEWV